MVNVSKKRLQTTQVNKLAGQLTETLGKLDASMMHEFLLEFLGKEEREELCKRLAVIVLVHEQHSISSISQALHMSRTTVAKLKDRYDQDQYKVILHTLGKSKDNYRSFVNLLDSIMTVGGIMPHRTDRRKTTKVKF